MLSISELEISIQLVQQQLNEIRQINEIRKTILELPPQIGQMEDTDLRRLEQEAIDQQFEVSHKINIARMKLDSIEGSILELDPQIGDRMAYDFARFKREVAVLVEEDAVLNQKTRIMIEEIRRTILEREPQMGQREDTDLARLEREARAELLEERSRIEHESAPPPEQNEHRPRYFSHVRPLLGVGQYMSINNRPGPSTPEQSEPNSAQSFRSRLEELRMNQAVTASLQHASSNSASLPDIGANAKILSELHHESTVPEEFQCNITAEIMTNPVFDPAHPQYKFERAAIERALELKPENPFTRTPLEKDSLVSDTKLKQDIDEYVASIVAAKSHKP